MKVRPSLRSFLLFAAASHLVISYAHAVNANWTGGGTDALWSNPANWSASPVPETGNTATFNAAAGAGGAVIDLGAGVTVNTITFASSSVAAYTIGAGAVNSQSLTLNGGPGNAGLSGSNTGGANTNQITINAAITVNNTQQWILFNGANPWIINGNVTPNGTAGSTIEVKNNGKSVIHNGLLADQVDGAKLRMAGANAQTATLTNPNSSFTGGLYFDNGSVSVNSIGMIGSPSAAGAGGDLIFGSGFGGGSLIYTGTGNTTDRVIKFNNGFHGPTITQSGASGLLNFTADVAATAVGSQTLTLRGAGLGTSEISGKIVDNGTAGTTQVKTGGNNVATLILNSVDGIKIGASVSGTGIADGTTVTAINTATRTITLSANTIANVVQNANITVDGVVNITHLTKTDAGTWTLSGANTHSGFTKISGGTLTLGNSLTLQNSPVDMVGSIAGTVSAGLKTTVTTLTLGGLNGTASPKNLASIFTTTSGAYNGVTALTLNPRAGASFSYSGVIANGATDMTLTKTGAGTQILGGNNTYTGVTTVSGGTLLVNNTTGSGTGTANVSVTSGTLGGNGFITGAVTIGNSDGTADAILAPGNSIDSIDTANLSFNSDGSYAAELDGTSVTSDVTNVTGTVTIDAAATLTVSVTGSLAAGQKYFIVVNDDVDAVTGTFSGLAQDAVVGNYGGTDLKISYTGDSGTSAITGGNDIVLYGAASGSPYDTWALGPFTNPFTSTLPGVDFDNDGLSNLLEFVLGGDPTISQAGIAPTASTSGGNLVLTFKRSDASELAPAVTVTVELSTDLTFSTPAEDITIGPVTDPGPIAPSGASYTVSNSGGFDTITVSIPQGAAPMKFARVKAVKP